MKNFYLGLIVLTVFFSCSTKDETPATTCAVNGITIFDEASTRFVFASDGNNGYQMTTINVYENTDSAFFYSYTYNGANIQTITSNEGGTDLVYTTAYDGDKLIKLTTDGGGNELAGEIVIVYSGNNASTLETWVKASDGNLYQIGHFALNYDGSGNLNKSEINLDITALFTIAFGSVPDTPYAPQFLGSVEYEYGQDDAPNPFYGIYYLENPDMSFMKNIPISITQKDANGSITSSESYAITFNEFGYPIKATSGAAYIEVAYDCN